MKDVLCVPSSTPEWHQLGSHLALWCCNTTEAIQHQTKTQQASTFHKYIVAEQQRSGQWTVSSCWQETSTQVISATSMRSICSPVGTRAPPSQTAWPHKSQQATLSTFILYCYSSDSSIIYPDYLFMSYFQGQLASLDRVIVFPLSHGIWTRCYHCSRNIPSISAHHRWPSHYVKGSDKGRIEKAQPKMTAKSQTLTEALSISQGNSIRPGFLSIFRNWSC